ncbi:hypothetical protein Bca4012_025844 [Brassica carinata]
MENSSIHLPDLKAGCCSNTAEVRLISFEEAKNVKNDGHHRDVQMLLPNERKKNCNSGDANECIDGS